MSSSGSPTLGVPASRRAAMSTERSAGGVRARGCLLLSASAWGWGEAAAAASWGAREGRDAESGGRPGTAVARNPFMGSSRRECAPSAQGTPSLTTFPVTAAPPSTQSPWHVVRAAFACFSPVTLAGTVAPSRQGRVSVLSAAAPELSRRKVAQRSRCGTEPPLGLNPRPCAC